MSIEPQSSSQTVGPFFHNALIRAGENILVNDKTRGERIRLTGQVFDGMGEPVPDAMLEIWQADATGHFNHPSDLERDQADTNFGGFGRSGTNANGLYLFETILPGAIVRANLVTQAPHINLRVFARGLLIHAVTRIYFADNANDAVLNSNASDAVLNSVDPSRRQTLIATQQDSTTFRFDIHLQGNLETVFFDV